MKSVVSKLTANERELLALLYERPEWKVLCKVIDIERLELAKDAIEQNEITEVKDLYGQAKALKKLVQTVRDNFRNSEKKDQG